MTERRRRRCDEQGTDSQIQTVGQAADGGFYFFYLRMFPVQLRVVLLDLAEIVLGLLELGFPSLDLLILPGHLQQGLHLVSTDQGKTC